MYCCIGKKGMNAQKKKIFRGFRLPVELDAELKRRSDVTVRRARRKMRAAMGWKVWKADILRHTAASMWLAEVGNAGTVSRQLGNSESVLLRSYWALTSPETAEKFWTI